MDGIPAWAGDAMESRSRIVVRRGSLSTILLIGIMISCH
jgi:hypothetical protein